MILRTPIGLGLARRAFPFVAMTAAAAVVLGACSAAGGGSPSPSGGSAAASKPLEGTNWTLTSYLGPGGTGVKVPAGIAATALFKEAAMTGNSGCNQYRGSYAVDGNKLTIGQTISTLMACGQAQMALEQAYLAVLPRVATFVISGDTLMLKTAEGVVGLEFAATPAPALTGTKWVATGINNGKGGVVSSVTGTDVTATFATDGSVSGSGGCNTYSGTYTTDGTKLSFGTLATTQMACGDAVNSQESAYFTALARVATYDFVGSNLELRAADGALQVSYQAAKP